MSYYRVESIRLIPTFTPGAKPQGLEMLLEWDGISGSGNPHYINVHVPWHLLTPLKGEIMRGLHDDIAGALRERLVEIIKGALKEVQEA